MSSGSNTHEDGTIEQIDYRQFQIKQFIMLCLLMLHTIQPSPSWIVLIVVLRCYDWSRLQVLLPLLRDTPPRKLPGALAIGLLALLIWLTNQCVLLTPFGVPHYISLLFVPQQIHSAVWSGFMTWWLVAQRSDIPVLGWMYGIYFLVQVGGLLHPLVNPKRKLEPSIYAKPRDQEL
jgi:hypothetical protein